MKSFTIIFLILLTYNISSSQPLYSWIGQTAWDVTSAFGLPSKVGNESLSYYTPGVVMHIYFNSVSKIVHKIESLIDKQNRGLAILDLMNLQNVLVYQYGFNLDEGDDDEYWYNLSKGNINTQISLIEGYDKSFYRINIRIWEWEEEDIAEFNKTENFVKDYFMSIDNGNIEKALEKFVASKREKMKKLLHKIAEETDYYKVLSVASVDGRLFWVDIKVELIQKRWQITSEENWTLLMHLVRGCAECDWQIDYVREY